MVRKIVKRDGRQADFDIDKIARAIDKAFVASTHKSDPEKTLELAKQVVNELDEKGLDIPSVEQIQDCVEKILVKNSYVKIARAYMVYRSERTRIRDMKTNLMQIYEDITFNDSKNSDFLRENAHINSNTAMGTMLKYGTEGAKQFYGMFVLKPEYASAHKNGEIHIHDLDFLTLTTTCTQIDLVSLFDGGFKTGYGYLREPNDISSYSALACIAIQSNQNDQHGGQSIANFDYAMAVGVRKTFVKRYLQNLQKALELKADISVDYQELKKLSNEITASGKPLMMENYADYLASEKASLLELGISSDAADSAQKFAIKSALSETDRATYQAMEAFIHNLNTMNSRAGAQTPFSTVNYGMDTSPEGRLAVKNLLLATEAGLGNGETPIFPIQIFRVKEKVNYFPDDPNYDLFKLACRVSAKRLFPNFSFQDAPFNLRYYKGTPETEIAYMGCRTRVIGNYHDPEREISTGRGNLSFTSINLPRIAIRSKGDMDFFYSELDRYIDMVIRQLMDRFEIQSNKHVCNYPFLMGSGVWIDSEKLSEKDDLREVLKHGTMSVGFIGLAEALTALIGEHHGQSEKAQKLGLEIISHMRSRLDEECEKTRMNFTLLATPAEGLSGRFLRLDKAEFGEIKGVTDKAYYTNSFHIPVSCEISAYNKIRLEAPYHALTNAGHISYVELDGDISQNPEAFERIIRLMHDEGIGYGSVNHPVDRDPVCGFSGIIGDVCPKCGRTEADGTKFERIRRITGYLVGTLERFNDAKAAEERERVKHSLK